MSSNSKSLINISNKYDRVVVLIDMDCFYCQVEEKLKPDLKGIPMAVVQYNTWQGGGIIAVNYAARAQGVTRHMRGNQAKEQCPDIKLVHVPSVREKADLTKYREAGKEVANVLQKFTSILERASVDEAYLDITKEVNERSLEIDRGNYSIKADQLINTYAVGYHNLGYFINEMSCKFGELNCSQDYDLEEIEHDDNDSIDSIRTSNLRLLIGASIANEIRAKVKEITSYECSAGIAHNKILAKLACGINKPNKQTLLPLKNIVHTFRTLEVKRITGLGGKFGEDVCEKLNVKYIGEVRKFSEKELQKKFDEKNGSWLYLISRGIDLEPVTPRFCSKSIGCCKKFPGKGAITGLNTLKHWLNELASEICDRLDKDVIENNRKAKQIVVGYVQEINSEDISSSRSTNLISYDPAEIAILALEVIKRNTAKFFRDGSETFIYYPIKFLGLSVGKFESNHTQKSTLKTMFEKQNLKTTLNNDININNNVEKKSCIEAITDSLEMKNNDATQNTRNIETPHCSLRMLFENQKAKTRSKESETLNDETNKKEKLKALHIKETYLAESCNELDMIKNSKEDSKSCKSLVSNPNTDSDNESLALEILKELEYDNITLQDTSTEDIIIDQNRNTADRMENVSLSHSKKPKENKNQPGTSTSQKYLMNYAEYQIPKIIEDFILCSLCKQKILVHQQQSHMDSHLAFQLSQQQREEYRKETRKQFNLTPPNKKMKLNYNDKKQGNKTQINISQYLLKFNEEPKENQIKCTDCNCYIIKDKILEHKDLHIAQKMQREWNSQNSLNITGESSSMNINSTFFSRSKRSI